MHAGRGRWLRGTAGGDSAAATTDATSWQLGAANNYSALLPVPSERTTGCWLLTFVAKFMGFLSSSFHMKEGPVVAWRISESKEV